MELDIENLIGFLSLIIGFLVTLFKLLSMSSSGQDRLIGIVEKFNSLVKELRSGDKNGD